MKPPSNPGQFTWPNLARIFSRIPGVELAGIAELSELRRAAAQQAEAAHPITDLSLGADLKVRPAGWCEHPADLVDVADHDAGSGMRLKPM